MANKAQGARLVVCSALLGLPLIVFFRCLFLGQAFVPADLLTYVAPWSHSVSAAAAHPWNVLRFDGVTQFYPWRLEAARSIHLGKLPFWNPYAFAASGGTPLWANSQSAPLYPINALFYLFPTRLLWYVFGLVAAIHMGIAAVGTYIFLRCCTGLGRAPGLLGAFTFALSGPVTCWLALPTFLSVACWLPWLLTLIHAAHSEGTIRRKVGFIAGAGVVAGLMILGGHLQITLYGLAFAAAYSLFLRLTKPGGNDCGKGGYLAYAAALALTAGIALCLAAPQLLPALELSRVSARASTGPPTWAGYASFVANALPLRNLVTLLFPNFFGHPNDTSVYWNSNNYGEWALFVGVTPLLLCFFAIGLPWRARGSDTEQTARHRNRGFFAIAAVVALLIAMGTPLNIPLFFLLPGYSQTGNPGRILVVVAFAVSVLAAIGTEALFDPNIAKQARERAVMVALGVPALLAAFGASRAAAFQREVVPGSNLASLLAPVMPSIWVGVGVFALAAVLIALAGRRFGRPLACVFIVMTAAELLYWGLGYNPTVAAGDVYPVTPGIAYLRQHASQDDLIAPLNRGWSLTGIGPRASALPPNGLTVYGLHDIGGYDSLFPRTAKDQVRDAGDGIDPSPPENGNMVFIKDPETAVRLGARYLVVSPDAPLLDLPSGVRSVYEGEDLLIYENASPVKYTRDEEAAYAPASIRFGLFAALAALAGLAALTSARLTAFVFRRR